MHGCLELVRNAAARTDHTANASRHDIQPASSSSSNIKMHATRPLHEWSSPLASYSPFTDRLLQPLAFRLPRQTERSTTTPIRWRALPAATAPGTTWQSTTSQPSPWAAVWSATASRPQRCALHRCAPARLRHLMQRRRRLRLTQRARTLRRAPRTRRVGRAAMQCEAAAGAV